MVREVDDAQLHRSVGGEDKSKRLTKYCHERKTKMKSQSNDCCAEIRSELRLK